MNQEQKLVKCAEVLKISIIDIEWYEEEVTDIIYNNLNEKAPYCMSFARLIQKLVTTLGIATWQDRDDSWWAYPKEYVHEFARLYGTLEVFVSRPEFHLYKHKDYSQAVIDCVAGESK